MRMLVIGNIGGPLVPFGFLKEKLFFFANFESRYNPQFVTTTVAIPTADAQNGNFTYLVNGTSFDWPEGAAKPASALFRNNGDGTFTDVTERAGVANRRWGTGICAGDYDNDGFTDLYVTYWGQNVLYRNQGDGTFRDVTATAGLGSKEIRWGTGCAFFDYDRDGRLDIAVANYARLDPATTPKPGANPLCMHKEVLSGLG